MRYRKAGFALLGILVALSGLAGPAAYAYTESGPECREFSGFPWEGMPSAGSLRFGKSLPFGFGGLYDRAPDAGYGCRESFGSDDRIMEPRKARNNGKANAGSEAVRYTVRAGDTLYRIAKFYDTTVDMLMLANHISDPTKLQIGTVLTIPGADQDIASVLADDRKIAKTFYATLTAYTAGYESTGKTPSHPEYGITASGAKVKENHTIAVDPKVIPLGSYVYIEGLGIRKAEDVGSAIKGTKIDVYIPDLDEALKFGVKKNVKVHVLAPKRKEVRIASANR